MRTAIIVGIGGFIGTIARFLLARYFQEHMVSSFPWATFIANIAGCFIIGLVFGCSEKMDFPGTELRLFLTVGICGGFTTFSAFSNEAFVMIRQNEWTQFALYSSLSFIFGLLAVFVGRALFKIG